MKRYRDPAERLALKRKGDANRLASIGGLVADSIRRGVNVATVTESKTTSDAPLLQILTMDGLRFNVTVTRARGKR